MRDKKIDAREITDDDKISASDGSDTGEMMTIRKLLFSSLIASLFFVFVNDAYTQQKAHAGKVCGDPRAACKSQEDFQPNELPFGHGKDFVITESEPFYAIILKSVKLVNDKGCDTAITEDERNSTQALFPRNKVFVLRCFEPGLTYYTNVANDVSFMAVFAGRTQAQANTFLKIVKATNKFHGAALRRMRTGYNGT